MYVCGGGEEKRKAGGYMGGGGNKRKKKERNGEWYLHVWWEKGEVEMKEEEDVYDIFLS